MKIEIRNNTAPYILEWEGLTLYDLEYSLLSNETLGIEIPDIYDDEENSPVSVELSIAERDVTYLPYIIEHVSDSLINVRPVSDADAGVYIVNITVYEDYTTKFQSTYQIRIIIEESNTEPIYNDQTQAEPMPGQLTGSLKEVSLDGSLEITFSKDVVLPPYSLEEMKDFIYLDLELSTPLKYTWTVTKMTPTKLGLKLSFEDPNMIGLSDVKDTITIYLNRYLYRAAEPEIEGTVEYLFNTQYEADIELIVDPDDPQIAFLTKVAEAAKVVLGAAFAGAFIVQPFLSSVMSSLWGVINSL